ncbi:hypothetical protein LTA6_002714 [Microbacterium sp. LTA6]|uniref:hypothetical protein n=1 Tax=Microbacterium sp. LTA6 TaxID=3129771 RepID=UPI0032534540
MARQISLVSRQRRLLGSTVGLACVIVLSGCAWFSSSVGESANEAEAGIVIGVDYFATSLAAEAFAADGIVSPEDLSPVVEYVFLDPSAQSVEGVRRDKAIYGLTSDASAATIDIFVPSMGSVNSGMYSESTDVFGCGVLRADFATQQVTLVDAPCPDWLLAWNGDDAEEVSLERAVENRGDESAW